LEPHLPALQQESIKPLNISRATFYSALFFIALKGGVKKMSTFAKRLITAKSMIAGLTAHAAEVSQRGGLPRKSSAK
jgi:hypothetical protein